MKTNNNNKTDYVEKGTRKSIKMMKMIVIPFSSIFLLRVGRIFLILLLFLIFLRNEKSGIRLRSSLEVFKKIEKFKAKIETGHRP